ncbi:MAG TPA: hypothetical protein VJT49_29660 [Amycolatopsis sp.]|uniref:hypothetical protein n=1 Tax=Amycolatopsis sp. TaxID=37632 RepID=UPI002B475F0D|nr:hypothetical protein [Amycolatopsis sp.]HKS49204.1 hypothetical protein [Amycolatopsis sp.]
MPELGAAAAEIAGARVQLMDNASRVFDQLAAGAERSFEHRAVGRRDQVRAAWRAVAAVDRIFTRSGGSALRRDQPLQRFWRDAHASLDQGHTSGPAYHAATLTEIGVDPKGALRPTL